MTKTKKFPMAKAIREFVAGMQLPPPKKPDTNYKLAALVLAMLQHCKGLESGATIAVCSPSLLQIAQLLHCSKKTCQRQLDYAESIRIVTKQRHGRAAPTYTIHQTGQQLSTHETGQQLSTQDNVRVDNPEVLSGQVSGSDWTTPRPDRTTVGHIRGKASGVKLQEKNKIYQEEGGSGLSGSKQTTDLKLPPGFVRRDGVIINTNSGGAK